METYVQMTGFVGGDVELRHDDPPVATFRLASTPRFRRGEEWADGPTTWLSVTCFRSLAENALVSIRRGDPVVVVGRLRTSVFEKDGQPVERLTLEATSVGHDLSRGIAVFRRADRASAEDPGAATARTTPEGSTGSMAAADSSAGPEGVEPGAVDPGAETPTPVAPPVAGIETGPAEVTTEAPTPAGRGRVPRGGRSRAA